MRARAGLAAPKGASPMTLQSLPQQPTVYIPTPGEHLAHLATESEKQRVLFKACDDFWDDWWQRCDALMLAQYPTPNDQDFLAILQHKPTVAPPVAPPILDPKTGQPVPGQPPPPPVPATWHEQRQRFPNDFQEDMATWVRLEPVSVRRNQVLTQLALLDALETGQQGMGNPPALPPPPPAFSPAAAPPPQSWPPAGPA